ncbi:MAG: lysophospholipid acyltransferase family protein [Caulobacterales bacterium]
MKTLRGLVFTAYFFVTMAIVGFWYLPAAILSRDAALAGPRVWARALLWGLKHICGADVRIEGLENVPKGPVLIASKHQAMLDTVTPFIAFARPAIILKRELLNLPLYGYFAKRAGMIAIDREGHAAALKAMLREARARMNDDRPVIIFPEGTRQEIGAKPDYKPGVAALYRDLGAPCVPVAVSTGLIWRTSGFVPEPGIATIKFLEPIPPGMPRAAFMRELESRIETASNQLAGIALPARETV